MSLSGLGPSLWVGLRSAVFILGPKPEGQQLHGGISSCGGGRGKRGQAPLSDALRFCSLHVCQCLIGQSASHDRAQSPGPRKYTLPTVKPKQVTWLNPTSLQAWGRGRQGVNSFEQ